MVLRIITICSITLLLSCNRVISKNEITKTEIIDTYVEIINPLKKISAKGFLFDTTVIDEKFFRITTTYDKKTAQIKTEFEPKHHISVEVKKRIETVNTQKSFKESEKKFDDLSKFLFIILFIMVIQYIIRKKFNL